MTIELMHYNIKQRVNKLDSEQYRNLSIPSIDLAINNAQSYLLNVLNMYGYTDSANVRDALSPFTRIVVLNDPVNSVNRTTHFTLPPDYRFYRPSIINVSTNTCPTVSFNLYELSRDDLNINFSPSRTSYRWGTFYCDIIADTLIIKETTNVNINSVELTYVKNPKYSHLAEKVSLTGYLLPDGTTLTGKQDSEFPEHLHEVIIQIASMLLAQGLTIPDYSLIKDLLSLDVIFGQSQNQK